MSTLDIKVASYEIPGGLWEAKTFYDETHPLGYLSKRGETRAEAIEKLLECVSELYAWYAEADVLKAKSLGESQHTVEWYEHA